MSDTEYNGIRFKSLLEAQWAIFFDVVSIPYRYRPFCLKFDKDFSHTPQFLLRIYGIEMWFEAFPRLDTSVLGGLSDFVTFASYARHCEIETSAPSGPDCCIIALGPPWASDSLSGVFPVYDLGTNRGAAVIAEDQPMTWAECRQRGRVGLWAIGDEGKLWWWRRTSVSDCCRAEMTGQGGSNESPRILRARLRAEDFVGRAVSV